MDLTIPLLLNDLIGWAAALLTLTTFICRDMRRLRLLALAANAAFIVYGALAHLPPVLALHLALVPVNLWRLNQTLRFARRHDDVAPPPPHAPVRARAGRPRNGWMSRRSRRGNASQRESGGVPKHRKPRPDPGFAERPAIQS